MALGSNLGDPASQLRAAAAALGALGEITHRSSLWRTAPVGGPPGQPSYLNAVLGLRPRPPLADPDALLRSLLATEARQGRQRGVRGSARTLDLDLLAFGARVQGPPGAIVPHPRMMERAFVLAPLAEVAPDWRHPVDGRRADAALAALGPLEAHGVRRSGASWDPG